MLEYGEAHFQSLLVNLQDSWIDLPVFHAKSNINVSKFPFDFSGADIQRIKQDCDGVQAGTDAVAVVKEGMGDFMAGSRLH
ncbi:phosphotransferase enzyme family protein [Penicillium malachiteum]|uniref:phosphotransferase enzyme family protein n=1 Tax=Penicillium malachiteum TaxID=1324776 RepID=UPI002549192B|nr:phosphotransferase enzyme family protein [Penicillium malachiteum]KAJ5736242.1 phosphotransferase enzyme family protein [Penicillium malachiteum]